MRADAAAGLGPRVVLDGGGGDVAGVVVCAGGGGCTTPVAADWALLLPPALTAVTSTVTVCPTSEPVSVYVAPVAFGIA